MKRRTDRQLVDTANALARRFYARMGYQVPEGYRFDEATHPHEVMCWENAVDAFTIIADVSVYDALANIED